MLSVPTWYVLRRSLQAIWTTMLAISFQAMGLAAAQSTPTTDSDIEFDKASVVLPVGGTALGHLDKGEDGELSIIAVGKPQQYLNATVVGFIVRNNTNAPVAAPNVSGEARTPDGKLVGATSGDDFLRSSWMYSDFVEPGAIQFGRIGFDPPLPERVLARAEFSIVLDEQKLRAPNSGVGLSITEFVSNSETLVGSLANQTKDAAYNTEVYAACFDETGNLTHIFDGTTSRAVIQPGDSSAFSLEVYPEGTPCETYLVTAWGSDSPDSA